MKLEDEQQRKVNDLIEIIMHSFTINEIQELQAQLSAFLGVLCPPKE